MTTFSGIRVGICTIQHRQSSFYQLVFHGMENFTQVGSPSTQYHLSVEQATDKVSWLQAYGLPSHHTAEAKYCQAKQHRSRASEMSSRPPSCDCKQSRPSRRYRFTIILPPSPIWWSVMITPCHTPLRSDVNQPQWCTRKRRSLSI